MRNSPGQTHETTGILPVKVWDMEVWSSEVIPYDGKTAKPGSGWSRCGMP